MGREDQSKKPWDKGYTYRGKQTGEPWYGSDRLLIEEDRRIAQQNVQATAIQPHGLGQISEEGGLFVVTSPAIPPGGQVTFQIITYQNQQKTYASAQQNTTIYIDTATTANVLPGGSAINETEWIWSIWEPFFYVNNNSSVVPPAVAGETVPPHVHVTAVYVSNQTASSHTIGVISNIRLIVEQGGGTSA